MGNWNYKSNELAKRLLKETVQKGGLEQIKAPTLECKVSSELDVLTVKMGGDPILVNYNKHREKQHKREKQLKRTRSLKRQIKRIGGRLNGDELPTTSSPVTTHLDSSRDSNS
jgi:hypothetical protein